MTKPITKAVIAAAGFGTRFLPQTKAMPKEMLPLIDKPIIQYVVEELVDAGIKDIIIVTGANKRSIEDHFDFPQQDLIANLVAGGPKKEQMLEELINIANMANFIYVRQKGPYGGATPLINASHLIQDEPFIYTYADDFITASPTRFKQMITAYNELNGPILSCVKVEQDIDYDRYGFVAGDRLNDHILDMKNIVEKPGKANAPSDLASVSGYLLTPDIFDYLEKHAENVPQGQEFMVQPAMQMMIDDGIKFYALEVQNGKYNDSGNKLEYLKTLTEFALKRKDIGPAYRDHLNKIIQE
jgi:UTP--glucose-1-phosphate uridylyltransferase